MRDIISFKVSYKTHNDHTEGNGYKNRLLWLFSTKKKKNNIKKKVHCMHFLFKIKQMNTTGGIVFVVFHPQGKIQFHKYFIKIDNELEKNQKSQYQIVFEFSKRNYKVISFAVNEKHQFIIL